MPQGPGGAGHGRAPDGSCPAGGGVRSRGPPLSNPGVSTEGRGAAPTHTALGTVLAHRGLRASTVPALGAGASPGRPAALSTRFQLQERSSQSSATSRASLPSPGHPGDGARGQGPGTGELAPLPQGSEAPRAWSLAASSRQPPRQAAQTLSTCCSDSYLLGTSTRSLLPQAHGSVLATRPGGSATRQLARAQSCGPQRPFP